jgi:hypothetical protein
MTTAELVEQSRAAQGLPPKITDPGALAKVAQLLTGSSAAWAEGGDGRGAP